MIKGIIEKYANAKEIEGGKSIYNRKMILKFSSNETQFHHAHVFGSLGDIYKMQFSISSQGHLTSSCNCSYYGEGICKHLVAALYYLDLNTNYSVDQQAIEKNKAQRTDTSLPFEMFIADMHHLDSIGSFEDYGLAHRRLPWIQNFRIDEESIIVEIPDQHNEHIVQVFIKPKQGALKLTSEPKEACDGLTVSELTALVFLKKKEKEYLFDLFEEDRMNLKYLQQAKRYGIEDIEKAKQYFEVNLDETGSLIRLKDEYENLLPISAHRKNFNDFVNKLTGGKDKRESIMAFQSKKVNEKNPFVLGFALQHEEVFRNIEVMTLLPFVGKKKVNGSWYQSQLQSFEDVGGTRTSKVSLNKKENDLISLGQLQSSDAIETELSEEVKELTEEQKQLFVLDRNHVFLSQLLPLIQANLKEVFYHDWSVDLFGYSNKIESKNLQTIQISEETPEPILVINTTDDFVSLKPKLKFEEGVFDWDDPRIKFYNPLMGALDQKTFLLKSAEMAIVIKAAFSSLPTYQVLASDFQGCFKDIVVPLSKYMTIAIENLQEHIKQETIIKKATKRQVYLKELNQFILIKPIVAYGKESVNILEDHPSVSMVEDSIFRIERDWVFEDEFRESITSLHPDFIEKKNQDFFHLHADDFIKDYWFLDFIEKLKTENIEVFGFNEFKNFKFSPFRPSVNIDVSSDEDWFDVRINVAVGDTQISLKDLKKALLSKEKYIKLGDGKLAILPEGWVDKLQKYLRMGKVSKDGVKISKMRFNIIDELFEDIDNEELLLEIAEKKRKIKEFSTIDSVAVPKVKAELRDYQIEGFRWLHFLHEFGWGGILADDMGLGKTIQIITFLKFLQTKKIKKNVVVVPTTLLFNWKLEIEKFCPSIKFYIHHGANRAKDKINWEDYDVVITTYGMISSDIELFNKERLGYLILDESQAIKNPSSKRFKAVNVLKASNRLALTGTPIENNTFDLYAQMTFVNPGLFISAESFRTEYAMPIDKEGDQIAAAELNKIIHPFILRRTKEMVAKELPEKTEDIIYCSMGDAQQEVYDAYRNEFRNSLVNQIEKEGLQKSKLHVLQALTKLRQVCNSPKLLGEEESYDGDAVKIKELIRHIQEKTGGHKLLIFSQFVKMLGLIKTELDDLNINYSYLDGKTSQKNRQEAVDSFQQDDKVRVFLISLKAGGTGLNLTAADYVYIVDPWWNPAVENQAIDRCYRIGQKKNVIAYRMICKDTIEEKIMAYKSKKQVVADAIIQTDENVMKQITKNDIMDLFG